jgi:hypothetical protein
MKTLSSSRRPRLIGSICALQVLLCTADAATAETCVEPDKLHVTAIDRAFVQQRFLAGVAEPLRSEGRLKVSPEKISWHMTVPFDVETVLTPTSITQSIDGAPPQQAGPSGSDISASIARLFASLLQGRWTDLQSMFHVSKGATAPGSPWSVSLESLDPQMEKILGKIEVLGCADISTIKIERSNGDREVIEFEAGPAPAP